ncbi:hypothetical protein LZF95_00865 [Algoriphagus sp. AGSA1]|uniref:hypothetical protein n=1 Tax=Algoriphagus sp. AGSA1 TaxID=2907213 RepID=UPI001F15D5AF|nr:hypothetical protein [Algoriphagus sp. AGSA1]MCE7053205.1 hypothetical protein [Algoriphagus sp. AGSA1]
MKNFLLISIILVIISCGEKTDETKVMAYIPELVITDSLVIDNLTELALIDVKEDHSEYLFYDFKTDEFFRVNKLGEIILKANRSEDGKDSFKARYFTTAHYLQDDRILVLTRTLTSIYDLDFNLIDSKQNDFELVSRTVGGSRAALTFGDYLYTFSMDISEDAQAIYESDEFSIAYPFMQVRDINTLETLHQEYLPKESQMAINPGLYNNLDPIVKIMQEEMFVVFPNSPEMYVYGFPELKLKTFWKLNPGEDYKQIKPSNPDIGLDGFFQSLAASEYKGFAFSNGYLLTFFERGAPQDEIDALPNRTVGSTEFNELVKKYKSNYNYQIFKGQDKIWQGDLDVNLWSVRDVLYSNTKPGEDPYAVEKDVQTIYFYELK